MTVKKLEKKKRKEKKKEEIDETKTVGNISFFFHIFIFFYIQDGVVSCLPQDVLLISTPRPLAAVL